MTWDKGPGNPLSHRKRSLIVQSYAHQRTGADDRVLRRFFTEIFKRCQGARHFLYFVEDDQSVFRVDLFAREEFKARDQPARVQLRGKEFFHPGIRVEIDVDCVLKLPPAELFHEPRLSDLTRTSDDEWFAAFGRSPFNKFFYCCSFHCQNPPAL